MNEKQQIIIWNIVAWLCIFAILGVILEAIYIILKQIF